jgi:hypothetical protein
METFLVRLWVPAEPDALASLARPLELRGVVDGGARHDPRPFGGANQLGRQLEEALADRLRDRAASSQCSTLPRRQPPEPLSEGEDR